MAIKNFYAIGETVTIMLDNGTSLFSKSLEKDVIKDLFQCAQGIIELDDTSIVKIFSDTNVKNMSIEEKAVVSSSYMNDVITNTTNEYSQLFEKRDDVIMRKGIELSIPSFVMDKYMSILMSNGVNSPEFQGIDNFWMWASLNPNKYAREELLAFLNQGGFMLTPNGYFVAYRGVNTKNENNKDLTDFISEQFMKVKGWKKSPANYIITNVGKDKPQYKLEKLTDSYEPQGESIGNLKALYENMAGLEFSTTYTDAHTGKFEIKLGKEVSMPREKCDESSSNDCSRGLHLGNKSFGVGAFGSTVIVCLCNPMNVVAVPKYNQNKLRCCAYFPMAIAKDFDEKDYSSFDDVYFNEQVLDLKAKAKANKPEEVTINKLLKNNDVKNILKNLSNVSKTIKSRITT